MTEIDQASTSRTARMSEDDTTTTPEPGRTGLRIAMDNDAIDKAGVAMMGTAATLRRKYDVAARC